MPERFAKALRTIDWSRVTTTTKLWKDGFGVIGCLCNDNFRKGRGDLSWHISAHMSWGKVRLEGNHKYFKTDAHFS